MKYFPLRPLRISAFSAFNGCSNAEDAEVGRDTQRRLAALLLGLLLFSTALAQEPKPSPAPARFRPLLGEYTLDDETIIILEKDGKLCAFYKRSNELECMREVSRNLFGGTSTTRTGNATASGMTASNGSDTKITNEFFVFL